MSRSNLRTIAATPAIALPWLVGFHLPPSATFFNVAISLIGGGVWLLSLMQDEADVRAVPREFWLLPVALGALLILIILSTVRYPQFWSSTYSTAATVCTACFVAAIGALHVQTRTNFRAVCAALLLAGLASSAIGLVQVFAPMWADGSWIASSSIDGRAVGNLRQPNHLCSLLLWALVGTVWLGEARCLPSAASSTLVALMLFALVLTGSRSGVLGIAIMGLWGLADGRLSRVSRNLLLTVPLIYVLFWFTLPIWSPGGTQPIGTTGRFTTTGDISSSRFAIWSNTLDLIHSYPWIGVGFGEFNFAWTLTEFPNRPTAFFDHTHNLPLQFAVELGLPLAAIVLALLGWGLWRAWRNCLMPLEPGAGPSPQRAAFVMLMLILMHSMLEYPLWYAYFLLPTAFLFGLCLATPGSAAPEETAPPRRWGTHHLLRVGAALMVLGALYSVYDYMRVSVIFAPPENAAPLAERIAIGQRSLFFSHHADYAAATTSDDPAVALPAARRAAHYLLDTRLMMAWANALHASGDSERAKYLAQRLVEFRNPMSEPYFAPCKDASLSDAQRPYQCFAPQRQFTFKDFR